MLSLEILAITSLTLGAFITGAAWTRRRAQAELSLEVERRQRAEADVTIAHRHKGEILANVSHEIRTPMNGVLGMADLLLSTELPAPRRHRALEVIYSSAQGLLALLDDLLDFSKIEAGKLSFQGADFRLRKLLLDVVELLRPRATEKGLDLRLEVDHELPDELYGDPARLRQVLFNLIGNAVKFTREGEVIVAIAWQRVSDGRQDDPADPFIDNQESLHLNFAIRDTGIGISPRDQACLFEPFAQADSTAAREFSGTGLGLVICKNLVELMGGEIGFASTREVGSTFWFALPLLPARQPIAATEVSAPHSKLTRPPAADAPCILVVDDNAINRLVAESQLEALGYRATAVSGGSRALELLVDLRFDAILMDCQMPILDGYQTTRRLRQKERESGQHTVVIGVTAHAAEGARQSALAAGMDDYLAKPYRIGGLSAVLQRLLPKLPEPSTDLATVDSLPDDAGGPLATIRQLEGSGQQLLEQVTEIFMTQGRHDLGAMRQALNRDDAGRLARRAHRLGGSAEHLGGAVMSGLCAEIEDLAQEGDLASCQARLQTVEEEFERIVDELVEANQGGREETPRDST